MRVQANFLGQVEQQLSDNAKNLSNFLSGVKSASSCTKTISADDFREYFSVQFFHIVGNENSVYDPPNEGNDYSYYSKR